MDISKSKQIIKDTSSIEDDYARYRRCVVKPLVTTDRKKVNKEDTLKERRVIVPDDEERGRLDMTKESRATHTHREREKGINLEQNPR